MRDQILKAEEEFKRCGSIVKTAENLHLSTGSVRKMLITAGVWSNKLVVDIAVLRRENPDWDNYQIASALKVSVKTVQAYSPYEGYESLSEPLYKTLAESTKIVDHGECGLHVGWTLTEGGVLRIFGSGPMMDYTGTCWGVEGSPRPKWCQRRDGISVRKIIVEDGVTTVGQYAFSKLIELEDVQLPDSILEIKGGAFVGENHLTKFVLPPKLTFISWDTFYSCTLLEEVRVPEPVYKIQTYAFHGCTSLERIYFYGNAPRTAQSTFDMCHPNRIRIFHKEGVEGFGETWNGMKTEVF